MIRLEKIRFRNILSFGNDWTEIQLDSHRTTLILGPNGQGKSTLGDALSFALYGKPYRNINLAQLVNSINEKDLLVELWFSVGSSRYHIRRGIKPAVFEIYKDDKIIKQPGSTKEYQEYLEKHILKLRYKSFCQIVILGNAAFSPFMQLPAASRREIIEDLLDLQIFSAMNTLLKEKVNTNKEELQTLKFDMEVLEEKKKIQKKYIASLEEDNKDKIKSLKESLKENGAKIKSNSETICGLEKEIKALDIITKDHAKILKKVNEVNVIDQQLKNKISRLKEEIEFFESNGICPQCHQDIEDGFKKDIVFKKSGSILDTSVGLEQLTAEYNRLTDRLTEITVAARKTNEIQHKITSLNATITSINNQIFKINEEIEKRKQQSSVKKEDLKNLEKMTNDLKVLESRKEDYLIHKNLLDVAGMLLKDGGIKTKIIKQYVPIINKLLAKYFAEMDFFVDFQIDENFNETIKSRFRDDFSYASFSEGEKQRIDLALLFTWRAVAKIRNSSSINLLLLDETLDKSLDIQGSEDFMRIIGTMLPEANIFIITHKQTDLVDKFDRTIFVEKTKNFSRIKVNTDD